MAFFSKRYHPPGTPAGTLTSRTAAEHAELRIHLIDYDSETVAIRDDLTIAQCGKYRERKSVTWIHIEGRPDEAALRDLGEHFELHDLALEDVLNSGQRPKVEPFGDHLFVVMCLPRMEADVVDVQQLSLFLCGNVLLSFHDGNHAVFTPIVRRLQDKSSRLRTQGADYLFYTLLDLVIDQGFPVLERFGLWLEDLEEQILGAVGPATLEQLHVLKRELILLRRMLWPQREVINQILRDDHGLVGEEARFYLRDCYDHAVQVLELLETYREMATSMLDIYLSSVSNRMNDIMRLLTVIATIFIPLTFIVGVYGMNFDRRAGPWSMPELGWSYGYPLLWLVMISVASIMVLLFRRRGWL
jgi:magnesium transporter